jgi:peptidoglycan glycosyltransferase
LGVVLIACFGLIIIQLINVQFARAPELRQSKFNPVNEARSSDNQRGDIYASDGTLLAESVKSKSGTYSYARVYPQGSLYSQVVGYDSTFYGTAGVEFEYNNDLTKHIEAPQNLSEVLGLNPLPSRTDSITLTIDPTLQKAAQVALSQIVGANRDAAVIAMDPTTGAVLADYSTPTFDPNPLAAPNTTIGTKEQQLAGYSYFHQPDSEGFLPGLPLATAATFPPGSTFKVVTTAAVYNLMPNLSGFTFPPAASTKLPNSNKLLDNDGGEVCGGPISVMLPQSCDPGYGLLGIALGAPTLFKQAELFGFNSLPPIDLPRSWVATPTFPAAATLTPPNQSLLAYSAIGQYNDSASALSDALVAAGIADGGVIMTPHVMEQVRDNQGNVVAAFQPKPWKDAVTQSAAAQVTALMRAVVAHGTASQVGFSPSLDAAVKTGTAQTGNPKANTDDWMIGFAPANNPKIAVAVVVPNQNFVDTGAGVAGPIMKIMLDTALLP